MILCTRDPRDTTRKLIGLTNSGRRWKSVFKYQQIPYIPITSMRRAVSGRGEMDHWVRKGACSTSLVAEVWPLNSCQERREELTPKSRPLTSICAQWHAWPTPRIMHQAHIQFFFKISFMFILCVWVSAWMYAPACNANQSQKRAPDALGLELQMVVGGHVSTGTQTCVLWKG